MDKKLLKSAIQTMIKGVTEATEPIITANHRIYPKEVLLKALDEKLKSLNNIEESEGDK